MLLIREFKLNCVNKSILTRYLAIEIISWHLLASFRNIEVQINMQDTRVLLTCCNDVSFAVHWALRDTTN